MKNKLTRKLMLSAFTLLFAVISLGASTYAWFTMSNKATVEAFNANVKAGEGIEIAVTKGQSNDGAQWYTGTLPDDIIQSVAVEQNFAFNAVTLNADKKLYKINASEATAKTDYIQFYIHIKTAEAGNIYLSELSFDSKTQTEGEITSWESDAVYDLVTNKTVGVKDKVLYEVENAARISFGEQNFEKSELAATGEATDGIDNFVANNTTGLQTKDSTVGAYSYYKAKNAEQVKAASSTYVTTTFSSTTVNSGEQQVTTYSFNNADKVLMGASTTDNPVLTIEVKVWIEGWDAECLNAIFAQKLYVAFAFTFEKKTN